MSFIFDIKKTVNALVFLINSLGGKADLYRICTILYFADTRHLENYGTFILGDTYIAMKYGPVPFNTLSIYKQLKGEGFLKNFAFNFKEYFKLSEEKHIEAIGSYDIEYLSESEVECLFASIQENKALDADALLKKGMESAWQYADITGQISFDNILEAHQVNPEMADYIRMSYKNEISSFNENSEA